MHVFVGQYQPCPLFLARFSLTSQCISFLISVNPCSDSPALFCLSLSILLISLFLSPSSMHSSSYEYHVLHFFYPQPFVYVCQILCLAILISLKLSGTYGSKSLSLLFLEYCESSWLVSCAACIGQLSQGQCINDLDLTNASLLESDSTGSRKFPCNPIS